MKYITRTIKTTVVSPKKVEFKNGKFNTVDLDNFMIDGNATEETILKECRKRFGKMSQYVFDVEIIENKYGMTVEKFLENAELLSDEVEEA